LNRRIFIILLITIAILFISSPGFADTNIIALNADFFYNDQLIITAKVQTDEDLQGAFVFLRSSDTEQTLRGEMQSVSVIGNRYTYEYIQDLAQDPLPPFSNVEYWLELKTEDGKNITTPKADFFYYDNLRDWQVIEEPPMKILWYDGDVNYALEVMDVARNGLSSIQRLITLQIPEHIEVFVYPDTYSLEETYGSDGRRLAAGHAQTQTGVILLALPNSPDAQRIMERRLPHELMHILLYQTTGDKYSNLPVWLKEGLAMLAEQYPDPDYEVLLTEAFQSDELIPMDTLCTTFPQDQAGAMLAYAQSASFTRYLYQRFGSSGLDALVNEYADGKDCQFGAQAALGVNMNDLEREWGEDVLGANPSSDVWGNLLPWLLLVSLVLALPLLLTIIIIRKKS